MAWQNPLPIYFYKIQKRNVIRHPFPLYSKERSNQLAYVHRWKSLSLLQNKETQRDNVYILMRTLNFLARYGGLYERVQLV